MSNCIFCEIVAKRAPAHCLYENENFVVILDTYPVRPGHTLVIPKKHSQFLGGLPDVHVGELFSLGNRLATAMRQSDLGCDDINFALNDGPAANQTVPHVHLHLVPRHRGDLRKLLASLARRPIQALLGPESSQRLSEQAGKIRQVLPAGDSR